MQNLRIREANNSHVVRSNKHFTLCIIRTFLGTGMRVTVNLNDQTELGTVKIYDVSSNTILPSEFQAMESTIPKIPPKQRFGLCLPCSKFFS